MTDTKTSRKTGSFTQIDSFGARPVGIEITHNSNPPDNMYGGCSIQVFDSNTGAGNLSNTHGDANGFLNYVNQFDQINFHYEDGGVEEWEYSPTFDDWQGKYGMDAVRAFYHSGHGGMDANGVFYAPMGARWNKQDWAISNAMSLGDQHLRYLFWSTCQSVEVLNGQSPIKTWDAVNKGLRMIFGFQSNSIDRPDYGSKFFQKWNTGASFSQAWQDASIEISSNQQVSSTACGATQAECQDRLWNERLFNGGSSSRAWYWWRWAGNAPSSVVREANLEVPSAFRRVVLARRAPTAQSIRQLLSRYGIDATETIAAGATVADDGKTRLTVLPDGSHDVRFGEPNRAAKLVPHAKLRSMADSIVQRFVKDHGKELVYDRATATFHAGGKVHGPVSDAAVADVTLHYRQVIDGIPVVMGSEGHVRVTLDPGGAVTRLVDNTRSVERSVDAAPERQARGKDHALDQGKQMLLKRLSAGGAMHDRVKVVPHTTEVGYRLTADGGTLVVRREVDVTTGRFTKRHVIEMPF